MIWEEDGKIRRLPASIETPDNNNDNWSGFITFLLHPTETSQYLYFYIIDILFAYQVMVADWDKTGNHDDRMNTVRLPRKTLHTFLLIHNTVLWEIWNQQETLLHTAFLRN